MLVTAIVGLPGMYRGMWTARMRANVSKPPPGAYPTVIVIVFPWKNRAASSVLTAGRAAAGGAAAAAGDAAGFDAGLAAAPGAGEAADAGEPAAAAVGLGGATVGAGGDGAQAIPTSARARIRPSRRR